MSTPLERLAVSRDKLNAMAESTKTLIDSAAERLAAVNPKLAAYIKLPCGAHFGWNTLGGAWCFVVAWRNSGTDASVAEVPIKDAGRYARIEAAAHIDALLEKLATAAEERVAAYEAQR